MVDDTRYSDARGPVTCRGVGRRRATRGRPQLRVRALRERERHGALSFDATIEWYEPLEGSATRQLSANPATLLMRVERRLALGVASTLDVARGSIPPRRVGPVAEWTAKWGTFRVEVLHRTTGTATEVRTALLATF